MSHARGHVADPRARFGVGDAQALPFDHGGFDAAVSGLVLNFVPDQPRAVGEMARAVRDGGTVAACVWDYAGEMQMMRCFWDAAMALDPAARDLDEGRRFPVCKPEPLARLFTAAGLGSVETRAIDGLTVFRDFDDCWTPFLGGQGPAPGYCMSLSEERRSANASAARSPSAPTAASTSSPGPGPCAGSRSDRSGRAAAVRHQHGCTRPRVTRRCRAARNTTGMLAAR